MWWFICSQPAAVLWGHRGRFAAVCAELAKGRRMRGPASGPGLASPPLCRGGRVSPRRFHPHGVVGLSRSVVTPTTPPGPDELLRNSRGFERRPEVLAGFSRSGRGQTVAFLGALLRSGVAGPGGERGGGGRGGTGTVGCAGTLGEGCQWARDRSWECVKHVVNQHSGVFCPGRLLLNEFLQISLPTST